MSSHLNEITGLNVASSASNSVGSHANGEIPLYFGTNFGKPQSKALTNFRPSSMGHQGD